MGDAPSEASILVVVKENVVDILEDVDEAAITMEISLKELGANSLDRAEIVTGSMEDLGLSFPMRELAKISNIGELVTLLYSKANG